MYLVKNQSFSASFIELISKRDDFSFGKIKIIQIDIQAGLVIQEFFFYNIHQESRFPYASKPFDPNDPVVKVDFIQKFPPDGYSGLFL
jgi:hypothetical protein